MWTPSAHKMWAWFGGEILFIEILNVIFVIATMRWLYQLEMFSIGSKPREYHRIAASPEVICSFITFRETSKVRYIDRESSRWFRMHSPIYGGAPRPFATDSGLLFVNGYTRYADARGVPTVIFPDARIVLISGAEDQEDSVFVAETYDLQRDIVLNPIAVEIITVNK